MTVLDQHLAVFGLAAVAVVVAAMALVTARRARSGQDAAERALAELRSVLVEQPGLSIVVNADGSVRAAYGAAPPGVSTDALFGGGIDALSPADRDVLRQALEAAVQNGSAELLFGDPSLRLTLRRTSDGSLVGRLADAAPERARTALLEAERDHAVAANTAKSRFLADMSHELRTPLNAIMGFSDVMRARLFGALPGRYAEYAEMIHESGRHLLDLINDVLDMSKIEASKYRLQVESVDAREPVSAALRLLRVQSDEAGVNLRGALPANPIPADLDKRAVKQIVINLVSNALKFTPRGGQVTVSLDIADGQLELAVADTGIGIAPDDLARLGRRYEQAGDASSQARGTGLGLSLVGALADLHGGAMTLESVAGEGTAVTVRLPVLRTAEPEPLRPEADIHPVQTGSVVPFPNARGG